MTLGPKLLSCSKMAGARRRKHQNRQFLAGSPALDASYLSSLSKQDLKHFSKSYILGFASVVFMDFPPRGRQPRRLQSRTIHTHLKLSLKRPKHNLKHFSKNDLLGFAGTYFSLIFASGGRLSYEAYNVNYLLSKSKVPKM